MLSRGFPLAVCGVLALGLAGCSSSAPKKTAATTTIARSATTTIAGSVTTPVAVGTTIPSTPISVATIPTPAVTVASASATTAAGRTVTKPNDNVHLGDSGTGVKLIQNALVSAGYKVTVDGKFGAQTDKAVRAFQAKSNLKQDGIVGPATWTKLQAAAGTGATATTVKPTATTVKATATTAKPTATTVAKATTTVKP